MVMLFVDLEIETRAHTRGAGHLASELRRWFYVMTRARGETRRTAGEAGWSCWPLPGLDGAKNRDTEARQLYHLESGQVQGREVPATAFALAEILFSSPRAAFGGALITDDGRGNQRPAKNLAAPRPTNHATKDSHRTARAPVRSVGDARALGLVRLICAQFRDFSLFLMGFVFLMGALWNL